jgi:small subunit ribosomal protein S6
LNRLYEGLFIFPETLDEEGLDHAVEEVKRELEKLGGSLESTTRMGKKTFARPLKKQKAGYYVMLMFKLDGQKMDAFKQRLKLATNVFRSQFILAEEPEAVQEA